MGSAGAKVASIVPGLADVYVRAGGQYEWDSAGMADLFAVVVPGSQDVPD